MALSNNSVEIEEAQVTDNHEKPNEGVEYEPLFPNESVTEEQLRGEESTGEKTATPESKAEPEAKTETTEKAKEDEKAEPDKPEKTEKPDETKAGEKPEEKQDKEEPVKPEKPPEGYVPVAALHEGRQKISTLKAEVQRLSAELTKAAAPKPESDDQFKDFKVLGPNEYKELLKDDPDAATEYLYTLTQYNEHQRSVAAHQYQTHQAMQAEQSIIAQGVESLESLIPGITSKEKPEIIESLIDFANENGVDDGVLGIITDPRTRLAAPDGSQYIMGPAAAQIVSLIKNSFDKISKVPNVENLRKEIELELRPKIEQELKSELMKKIQQNPDNGFVSLDQVAGSGDKTVAPSVTGILSEADLAKLSEAEQRAYLGG